jgi:hypothetical protein
MEINVIGTGLARIGDPSAVPQRMIRNREIRP